MPVLAVAEDLAQRCASAGLARVRRVAVSDFSLQGVAEFALAVAPPPPPASMSASAPRAPPPPGSHHRPRAFLCVPLERPPELGAPSARKPRDAPKANRGFALLCFQSADDAEAAASSPAFEGLRATRLSAASGLARPYFLGAP